MPYMEFLACEYQNNSFPGIGIGERIPADIAKFYNVWVSKYTPKSMSLSRHSHQCLSRYSKISQILGFDPPDFS